MYLDHTGATLYAKSQLQNYHDDLMKNMYGNPHSSCLSSEQTLFMIDDVRQEILSFFKTSSDEYSVIFTCNATHGIKLTAENFEFQTGSDSMASRSWFVYLQDNHTSVIGIRAVALEKGVQVRVVDYQESLQETLSLALENSSDLHGEANESSTTRSKVTSLTGTTCHNNLFVYPAMSNFSGRKYPFDWILSVQSEKGPFSDEISGKWFVLLDTASYVSTSQLDLSLYRPDFVPISFYKLFGFPTGLGALLVSVRGTEALNKTYFGGGSVSAYASDTDFHVFKSSLQDR